MILAERRPLAAGRRRCRPAHRLRSAQQAKRHLYLTAELSELRKETRSSARGRRTLERTPLARRRSVFRYRLRTACCPMVQCMWWLVQPVRSFLVSVPVE